jgi:hypothetical protein
MHRKLASILVVGVIVIGALSVDPGAQGSATGLPWTSTFENGNFSEWNRGADPAIQIVSSGAQAGSHAARAPLVAGSQNEDTYAEHVFGDWFNLPTPKERVEELYVRLYSKFSSGYQFPSTGNKVMIINLTDGTNSQRRYQVYISINSDGSYRVDHSYIDSWQFFGMAQNVGTPARVRFDQWDKLKLYVRLNTPGQANGVVRLWINDQLKLDYTNRNIRQGTSFGMGKLILSAWAQPASPVNGFQWWDSWTMSQTDPDGSTTPPAPNPPTNVRIVR